MKTKEQIQAELDRVNLELEDEPEEYADWEEEADWRELISYRDALTWVLNDFDSDLSADAISELQNRR